MTSTYSKDDKLTIGEIQKFSCNMRKNALDMSLVAKEHAVHFGGGMSVIDILAVLYCKILKLDIDNPHWEERDRFILSKGHGAIGLYSALIEKGYISNVEKNCFEQDSSYLMGHPIQNIKKGIEFTNGSLGMGLGLGIGTAIACKKKGINNKIFVLVGDGEMNEGSIWESIMFAPNYKLDNLYLIIDNNHMQLGGTTNEVLCNNSLKDKLEIFGWDSYEIDGHNIKDLYTFFLMLVMIKANQ